jgi:hypothetical protein
MIPLGGVLQHALLNKQPKEIHIGIVTTPDTLAEPMPNVKYQTGGFEQTLNLAISPIFLMFFERYNDWLDKSLGDAVNWPSTLNFARVVRNAIAHGAIRIRNPKASPVTWRGISYGYTNNGQQIIGAGLGFGEIFALMLDCDKELDSIKAPIL